MKLRKSQIMRRQGNEIGQRRGYPKTLKLAAVKQSLKKDTSVSEAAAMFNVSTATVRLWRQAAGVQNAVPVGIARYQASMARDKAYNTPTVNANGTISYRGKIYS